MPWAGVNFNPDETWAGDIASTYERDFELDSLDMIADR